MATREQHREYERAYRERHKEKLPEMQRNRRKNNPESYLASERKWYAANAAKKYEYHKQWRKDNPEKVKEQNATRRARRLGQFVERVDYLIVFERDGGVCQICDLPIGNDEWHVDHILPLIAGGEHGYANVQLSHALCNLRKGARILPIVVG